MEHTPAMEFPEEIKKRARDFFAKATEVAYTLQYDYAIEMYLDGLSFWPVTLDEGHKPLRDISLRRQGAGGKKSGFGDGSKYKKASGKNPKDAMLKAEYLLSKDPANQSHMMDMIKAAMACEYREITLWVTDMLFDNNLKQEKPSFKTYVFLKDVYIKMEVYTRALHACQLAVQINPKDTHLKDTLRDLSAQATMQEGRYEDNTDFRDSIKDKESQEQLHSGELLIRSEKTIQNAITRAREEYEAEPTVPGKIDKLATELCNTENPDHEKEAIRILEKAYADLDQFRFKQRAGEIHIKQATRVLRVILARLKKNPKDQELAKKRIQAQTLLLQSETEHYKECVRNYPTDMRMKFEYGKRLLMARQFDEAIPLFQEARNDPRHRIEAMSGIGSCFFYKEWYTDAIETFQQALEQVENKQGPTAKELLYNLGRANEADGKIEEALQYYRKIAQIDFNYRDARKRVDTLRQKEQDQKGS